MPDIWRLCRTAELMLIYGAIRAATGAWYSGYELLREDDSIDAIEANNSYGATRGIYGAGAAKAV